MTARGLLIRVASGASAVVVLGLVTPAEFGLLAIVRAAAALLEQGAELGLVWALLRKREEPQRQDYAALAGVQLFVVLAALGAAAFWRPAGTLFGSLDARWHGWLLAVIAAMLAVPMGTGARVRLERQLRYKAIAFAEVSALVVNTAVLIGFLLAGRFAIGVFASQIATTLYVNAFLYARSPGPAPSWHIGRIWGHLKGSAAYPAAYSVFIARDQLPPLLLAALFDLRVAGAWAFAGRAAKFLAFAHEGFARVAVPTAARLAPDRPALRRLTSDTLAGAAIMALPVAAAVIFALPAVPLFWPQWAGVIHLAQLYIGLDVAAGVLAAALGPVALTLAGPRAVFIEHSAPLLAACAGFVVLWSLGRDSLQYVVAPMEAAAVAALFAVTDPAVLPRWTQELTRLAAALACAAAIYGAARLAGAAPVATAIAAGTALAAWMWRPWLRRAGLGG